MTVSMCRCPCRRCECFPDAVVTWEVARHHLQTVPVTPRPLFACPCQLCSALPAPPPITITSVCSHLRQEAPIRRAVVAGGDDGEPDDAGGDDDESAGSEAGGDDAECEGSDADAAGAAEQDDEQDDSWPEVPLSRVHVAIDKLSKQMIEAIGHGRISQTGADCSLAMMHDTLLALAPRAIQLAVPRDWRTLKTLAEMQEPAHWFEHFCPGTTKDPDHHLFSYEDRGDTRCPICKKNTRYKHGKHKHPARAALYYKFDWWVEFMYSIPEMA